jgi:hypothetical protein
MRNIEMILKNWEASLCQNVSLAGLLARNPTANKWKVTYRSLVLRECVFWRTHDLLVQSHTLFKNGRILGSRILLRSAFESVATLIYLNQMTEQVLAGKLHFHEFSAKTCQLLLGSRNQTTKHSSINIITVLGHCDKKYKGISDEYAILSESAHPNFEGACFGYSRVDHERDETNFANHWHSMCSGDHESLLMLIAEIFENEYNNVWPQQLEALEAWLVEHDAELEETKGEIV